MMFLHAYMKYLVARKSMKKWRMEELELWSFIAALVGCILLSMVYYTYVLS